MTKSSVSCFKFHSPFFPHAFLIAALACLLKELSQVHWAGWTPLSYLLVPTQFLQEHEELEQLGYA